MSMSEGVCVCVWWCTRVCSQKTHPALLCLPSLVTRPLCTVFIETQGWSGLGTGPASGTGQPSEVSPGSQVWGGFRYLLIKVFFGRVWGVSHGAL